ncbi:MAG: hypothetical protein LGR52_03925 [Candidatus Thiosymbion ectosymbiont of Robbea hypermnestra]|nr:hypothetical protein [Candidatus Thiosymbion ectosymbiont of Robbea hypermnestra]
MKAITDNEIKVQGIEALISSLGEVRAERFISLMLREPFDYTEWQKKLWIDKSIEEISSMAMKNYRD